MNDLELLRSADPVEADPTPAALSRARSALVAETGAHAPYDGMPARRPRRRRWAVAAACVAAAAVALVVVPVLDSGPARPTATADAAQVFLLRSADAAGVQPAEDAREAGYWYVRSAVDGARSGHRGTREVWLGRTASGVLLHDGKGMEGGAPTPLGQASFFGLTWEQLFDLPTDTAALRAEVYRLAGDAGPGPDAEAFVVVGDLLRESPAPPAVRAALLRVAATIPGVALGAPTTDSEGRAVVPVSRKQPGYEHRLLLDPDDGRLLGEESVSTQEQPAGQPALPVGTVTYRATTLAAGPVDDTGTRR